jgi:hypothetical protein
MVATQVRPACRAYGFDVPLAWWTSQIETDATSAHQAVVFVCKYTLHCPFIHTWHWCDLTPNGKLPQMIQFGLYKQKFLNSFLSLGFSKKNQNSNMLYIFGQLLNVKRQNSFTFLNNQKWEGWLSLGNCYKRQHFFLTKFYLTFFLLFCMFDVTYS